MDGPRSPNDCLSPKCRGVDLYCPISSLLLHFTKPQGYIWSNSCRTSLISGLLRYTDTHSVYKEINAYDYYPPPTVITLVPRQSQSGRVPGLTLIAAGKAHSHSHSNFLGYLRPLFHWAFCGPLPSSGHIVAIVHVPSASTQPNCEP